jgi:sporulation protein YlmC with PRC-barrel domain
VLISRDLLGPPDWVDRAIPVNQTRSEVRHDPPVSANPPLYRQMEIQAASFYALAPHWTPFEGVPKLEWPLPSPGKNELRSLKHLCGYSVVTSDGSQAGRADDFVANNDDWQIQMLAIHLADDPIDRTVAIDIHAVSDIAYDDSVIHLEMDRAHLSDAPIYNPLILGNPAFQEEVAGHFGALMQHVG